MRAFSLGGTGGLSRNHSWLTRRQLYETYSTSVTTSGCFFGNREFVALSKHFTPVTLDRSDASLAGESLGQGQDVLLLHAGGEDKSVWHPVMQVLADHGFHVVAYDQRGHGESYGSMADGIEAYGEDAVAMIGQLKRPIVVGGSLGGFALMLALETCEPLVSGLVLVDVTPRPDPEKTRCYLAPHGDLGASPIVENILSQTDQIAAIVSEFSLPVYFVGGGERSPVDDKAQADLAALCPQTLFSIIEQAGHLVARDAPVELAQLIIGFAEDLERDAVM